MMISDEQRHSYYKDGYLILDPRVPFRLIEAAVDEAEEHYPGHEPGRPFEGAVRGADFWKTCPSVHALAVWPAVLEALEQLYGRRPLPFQTLNFPVGTEQKVHADSVHFNSLPGGWMCGVWTALEDIDLDCGPLVYYPGSHVLPDGLVQGGPRVPPSGLRDRLRRLLVRWGWKPERQDYAKYENDVARELERLGLEPHYATLKKGQVLVWSANLLHGGSRRLDPRRTRHSQVTHYFFEGLRNYRPLYTSRRHLCWHNPAPIPTTFGRAA